MQNEWIKKEGYETRLLADGEDLNLAKTEAQIVRFRKGKFAHYHKEKTEFFYFTSGEGQVIIDDQKQLLKKGSHILVKPGSRHEFINETDTPLEAVMFKTNSDTEDTYI